MAPHQGEWLFGQRALQDLIEKLPFYEKQQLTKAGEIRRTTSVSGAKKRAGS